MLKDAMVDPLSMNTLVTWRVYAVLDLARPVIVSTCRCKEGHWANPLSREFHAHAASLDGRSIQLTVLPFVSAKSPEPPSIKIRPVVITARLSANGVVEGTLEEKLACGDAAYARSGPTRSREMRRFSGRTRRMS